MDKDRLDDINRDNSDEASLAKDDEWRASEEYANAVQLKFEALLADNDRLSEAMGYDGIQYPKECDRGLWEGTRKMQIAHENDTYYPQLAALVLKAVKDNPGQKIDISNDDALTASLLMGRIVIEQIAQYLHKEAVDKVEEILQ